MAPKPNITENKFTLTKPQTRKMAILCIDDENFILHNLKDELTGLFEHKYTIELAESGPDALAVFNELLNEGYDIPVVISDYIMPGMKGDELLTQIHQLSPPTLTVMLTGQAVLEGVTNAINHADLFKYIEKPWQKEELRAIVSQAVELYYQNQKLSLENNLLRDEKKTLETVVSEKNRELEQIQATLGATEQMIAVGELAENLLLFKEYADSLSVLKSNLTLLKELGDVNASNNGISGVDGGENTYLMDERSLYTKTNAGIEKILIAIRERNSPAGFEPIADTMLDLNECINHCVQQMMKEVKLKPIIKTRYGDLPPFRCNPRQMEYILYNLLLIAVDVIQDPLEISIHTSERNNTAIINIESCGAGIRANMFTAPFCIPDLNQSQTQLIFQLSTIYQQIKELQGKISLKSRLPSVSTFTVELPAAT